MLWHVRPDGLSRPEGRFLYDLHADRVRELIVEVGDRFDGQLIADELAAYKALMAFPESRSSSCTTRSRSDPHPAQSRVRPTLRHRARWRLRSQ